MDNVDKVDNEFSKYDTLVFRLSIILDIALAAFLLYNRIYKRWKPFLETQRVGCSTKIIKLRKEW